MSQYVCKEFMTVILQDKISAKAIEHVCLYILVLGANTTFAFMTPET